MEQDIQAGDFEISKFMGYTYPDIDNEAFKLSYNDLHKYHQDWNLFMSVVEKIQSLEKGKWHDKSRGLSTDIWLSFQKINISETYKLVVQFIQWYNQQKLENKK